MCNAFAICRDMRLMRRTNFHIKFLGRELDGGITRVNTGKLYMFRNGISQYLAVPSHSIHLNLLGIFNELGDDNRMILADISSQLEEAFQARPC